MRDETRVVETLPLVTKLVDLMLAGLPAWVDRDDALGAATEALVEAAEKFDEKVGTTFAQYVTLRTRWAVMDWMRHQVYGPVKLVTGPYVPVLTLDDPERPLVLPTPSFERDLVHRLYVAAVLRDVLPVLTGRHAYVITAVYFEGRTDIEVAEEWGVTSSRVGQIRKEALERMRAAAQVAA